MAITDSTQFGKMGHFKFWCQKVLPAVYDDSLSYYELLCKVTDYINQLIDITNTQSDAITEMQTELENFLDGEITPYIEAQIDAWFLENEPEIMSALDSLEDDVAELQQRSTYSKEGLNIICISDSYGRGVGASDGNGWVYYLSDYLIPNYIMNVSNSGAGFVAAGHSEEYGAINFYGQVDWAYDHLPSNISAEDIDIVIIAGGYNDHGQSAVTTAARNTVNRAQSKFPKSRVVFFPLCVGDKQLNAEFYSTYGNLVFGAASGGAEVHNQSLFWLYPFEITTSSGDTIHPNALGYRYIATFMCGCILGGNYNANAAVLAASAEGFSFASGVTTVNFRAGVQNGFAFYGGAVKRIGEGDLMVLPSYCRPRYTRYILIFGYADTDHEGIWRCRILPDGTLSAYKRESGTYDATLEYTWWIPDTVIPLGHLISG